MKSFFLKKAKDMNIQTKYDSLNTEDQKQVDVFLEFVLNQSMQKRARGFDLSSWKKKIKKISAWSEKGVAAFNENKKLFSQWKVQQW